MFVLENISHGDFSCDNWFTFYGQNKRRIVHLRRNLFLSLLGPTASNSKFFQNNRLDNIQTYGPKIGEATVFLGLIHVPGQTFLNESKLAETRFHFTGRPFKNNK